MKTELVFIMDESGSMSGLEMDVIGGFNSMLKKQKEEEGEALVTTVLFDTKLTRIHNRVNIKNVNELTNKDYAPKGCTALLDAIGITVNETLRDQKMDNVDKTIVVITTDGLENSSKEYNYKQIKSLIEKTKENNFEFVFLGANIDSKEEAEKLGISACNAVNYNSDSRGTQVAFEGINKKLKSSRKCMSVCADESWREDIDADYAKRK